MSNFYYYPLLCFQQVCIGLLVGLLSASSAWAQVAATSSSIFLLGGTGPVDSRIVAQTLQTLRAQAGPQSTLVLLGNQLYKSLPPATATRPNGAHAHSEQVVEALKNFPGRIVLVPGSETWQPGREQQLALEQALSRRQMVMPDLSCPSPVEIPLDAQHTLVVLNTPWWLYADDLPRQEAGCDAQDPSAVIVLLDDILRRNYFVGKQVVVAGYHSIYRLGGYVQQAALPNPGYRLLSQALRSTLEKYPGLTYVSGHGRRSHYEQIQAVHYLVSGASFAGSALGFTRLDFASDGIVRASYWTPDVAQPAGREIFAQQWTPPVPQPTLATNPSTPGFTNQTTITRASTRYAAGQFKTWLQGANYRREWQQPVQVPVLDLGTAEGGLIPLKRGGGMQTTSLRLRAANGQEYMLRSVEKNTDRAIPSYLRHTFAAEVVQDQISASHPYASLAVPVLAEAAGVGHTNPQLVYVPDDPRLGEYRQEFAGSMALLETREPAPPLSFSGQANGKKYGTQEVLNQLRTNPNNQIDERAVLRARLLDMVLADWDRHDDQWRWLAYPRPEGGLLFRAVPRDRDQAFFVNEGFLPRRARAEYALPQVQGFAMTFRNINSFNFNARYFDRSFLTGLTLADWQSVADSVKANLSDAVLEESLHQWPDSIYRLSGATILAKLKAHRDQLPTWAAQYYQFLAQEVDVVGTNEGDYVEVMRQDDDHTRVTIYSLTADRRPGAVYYQRTFLTAETREIRLYALGADDVFVLRGQVRTGPLVRLVGGAGVDHLQDQAQVKSGRRKTKGYDEPAGLVGAAGPDTKLHLTAQEVTQPYDRKTFQYPFTAPLFPWGYNIDDGVFLGLGVMAKRPGFRKMPWSATHILTGNVALATGAFNFAYNGQLTRVIGPFDLHLQALVQAPNFVRNFYGLGNNTLLEPGRSLRYYRVRFRNVTASALLRRQLSARWQVYGGPTYQYVNAEDQSNRILHQIKDERLHPASLFDAKQYAGGRLGFELTSLHASAAWPQGAHWLTEITTLRPLTTAARPLTQLTSELAFYRSFRLPVRLTLATRFGSTVNFGTYEFFQAATLGGLSNLRGYRRMRFAGRQSLFNNTEARLQLGSFTTHVLPITFGVLGFHDMGRVWVRGEQSSQWHRGYGGGIWLTPLPKLTLAAMYGFSREDSLPLVRAGFLF